ncbi:MAG: insulinase family protein [Oscillospiraceae bacterium]|jgi:predicted Zn-dependent peptidase|nr:insulinase family protein [Oscillospiraceae bacterium]
MTEQIRLPNGTRLAFEHIPYVRSAALGVLVGAGSRHETARENGASHFLEHMLFKGTETRSAARLAEEMDAIGGQINAYTSKETTCFHGRVLDTHLDKLSEILADMLLNSRLDDGDVASERGVIYEEIDMYNDQPDDLVNERLLTGVFKGNSLARPILGTKASLSAMTGASLREYMNGKYRAGATIIALAGSFKDGDIRRISELFSALPEGGKNAYKPAKYVPTLTVKRRALEQNHVCVALPGIAANDPRRFAMQLFSDILGGGMSSRLFQKVREERGLCYGISTSGVTHLDTGIFTIYTALGYESQTEAVGLIAGELKKMLDSGVTDAELSRAREQVKANVLMSLESTTSRSARLTKLLNFERLEEPDEIIAAYDAVTREDVRAVAEYVLDAPQTSLSVVGKTDGAADLLATLRGQ